MLFGSDFSSVGVVKRLRDDANNNFKKKMTDFVVIEV